MSTSIELRLASSIRISFVVHNFVVKTFTNKVYELTGHGRTTVNSKGRCRLVAHISFLIPKHFTYISR